MGEASPCVVLGRCGVEVLLVLLFCGVRLRLGSSEATVAKGDATFELLEEGVRALATVLAEGMRCTSDVADIVAVLLLCLSVVSQLARSDSLQSIFAVRSMFSRGATRCHVKCLRLKTRQTVPVLTPLPHH